ncbi:hypothetical protein DPMN_081855 [Dreissena polymorpha]|uniref:Uncharacterized protein n=1 Tax=Dreissena polymorpha TaxID=45954 RepID=A0A9D3Y6N2_DREPO|nr:hypothetical protein DPMN_081855 [Dreissena polymorpha]
MMKEIQVVLHRVEFLTCLKTQSKFSRMECKTQCYKGSQHQMWTARTLLLRIHKDTYKWLSRMSSSLVMHVHTKNVLVALKINQAATNLLTCIGYAHKNERWSILSFNF